MRRTCHQSRIRVKGYLSSSKFCKNRRCYYCTSIVKCDQKVWSVYSWHFEQRFIHLPFELKRLPCTRLHFKRRQGFPLPSITEGHRYYSCYFCFVGHVSSQAVFWLELDEMGVSLTLFSVSRHVLCSKKVWIPFCGDIHVPPAVLP